MSSPENNPPLPPPEQEGAAAGPVAGALGTAPGVPAAPPPYPPWPIWEILLVLGIFTGTQLAMGLAVGGLLKRLLAGREFSDLLAAAMPTSLIASHLVGWFCIYWVVRRRHRWPLLEGLRLGRYPVPRAAGAFATGMVLQMGVAILTLVVPPPGDFVAPVEEFLKNGAWAVAVLFLMAVVMAPPLEEALFRGLLQPAIRLRFNFPIAAGVVTVLFTALHATQTGTYWPPIVGIGLCGFLLAWLRERSGSLWSPIAFHAGFNFTAFLPLLLGGQPI